MAIRPRRGAPRGGTRLRRQGNSVSGERASRVVGSSDNFNFELGGATLFHRIQDYLFERFGLRYGNMRAILGLGVRRGAGTIVLPVGRRSRRSGAVISTATTWRSARNASRSPIASSFRLCRQPLSMPLCSTSSSAFRCARTCRSNTRTSGSPSCAGSAGPAGSSCCLCKASRNQRCTGGCRNSFVSSTSSGLSSKASIRVSTTSSAPAWHHLDVVQTRDHIREHWGRHFEVLEFIDSLAANQDLVVMRAGGIG